MNPDANTATPAPAQETSASTILKPPVARREPVKHVLHGDRRVDHYAWLRHKENPEVIDYLKAENAYTDAILKPTENSRRSYIRKCWAASCKRIFPLPINSAGISTSRAPKKESSMRSIAGSAMRMARRKNCCST